MTKTQKIIKYCAIVFAIFLIIGIFSSIIHLLSSIFFVFSEDSDIVGENKTYELSDLESVKNLDITIGAAALEIKSGEAFSVESNHKYLKAQVKNDTLLIDEDIPFRWNHAEGVKVILTVPSGFSFDRAEIETGAGKLTVESLCAKKLSMELGAGETVFENLTVTAEAAIETGVGRFSVLGGSIADLDLQMGVGDVSIKTALTEEGEFECGIGKTEIFLLGTKDDYAVSVEKGIGSATVDGKSVSNGERIGNGSVSVEIHGGIGNIQIVFAGSE